jgi:hypothetical protein
MVCDAFPTSPGLNYVEKTASNLTEGNIGIKVLYVEVLQEFFRFPPLTSKKGKYLWIALVPIYWALAFIVCAAIPAFSAISGLVGAVCIRKQKKKTLLFR